MVGLDCKGFEELLIHFKETYREINHYYLEEKLPKEILHRFCIKNKEDLLFFFTVTSIKCGNTYGSDRNILWNGCFKYKNKSRKRFKIIRENIRKIRLFIKM